VLKAEYYDTCSNCDNDGHADAGEVLDYIFEIRNSGSPADSVYAKIRHNYIEDTINFSVLTDSVFFGSIGVFRTLRNDDNPFKIKILEDCYNNTIVSLHVTMGNLNDEIIFEQEISFRILNGTEVSGILLQDTVFTPDKKWLISSSLRISEGVTLTILPGTDVEILAGVDNRGLVFAEGTAENRITMNGIIGGNAIYKYADIDVKGGYLNINNIDNCHIKNITRLDASTITNTRFTNVWLPMNNFHSDSVYRCFFDDVMSGGNNLQGKFYESVFSDLITLGERIPNPYFSYSKYNVFNKLTSYYYWSYPTNPGIYLQYPTFLFRLNDNQNRVIKNSFINNSINSYFVRADGSENYITVSEQFWGSSNQDIIRPKYYDFINDAGLPYAILEPKLDAPSDSCHAHVWKVLVNGLDAQDTIVEPVGVGQQRFDVYFNRPMKQSVNPEVSFGGLFPYISTAVDENPSWSDDGLVFTVYKTINLTNADGLNTIRVAGGIQDADWGWEVPLENQRFKFRISAASSASNLFMATPGLGKVSLEWNNNDLDDGLGYNMYRMEQINDSTLSSPILINPTLIIDTLYTDYAVTHNKKYFYYFKILRTNFSETDSSKVVAAIPFTASIGDANGDLIVNLLDIIDIVSYILNNNPQPFIFEAADVNGDEQINLLDIISVVNIIMGEKKQALFSTPAYAYLEPKEISLKSDGTLSGFQFQLISPEIEKLELRNLLPGFEFIKRIHDDTLTGLVFSMDNKAIPEGKINLFEKTNHPGTLNWGELFAGNLQGDYVPVYKDAMQLPEDYRYNFELYPNPSYGDITLEMFLPEQSDLEIIIYNTLGQVVYQRLEKDLMKGNYTMQLNIKGQLARGLHYVNIAYLPKNKTGMMNYRKVKKMILN